MIKGAYHRQKDKPKPTREELLTSYVIEAIAYMECQPATAANVKNRRQLREVAQYINTIDKSSQLAGCNHD